MRGFPLMVCLAAVMGCGDDPGDPDDNAPPNATVDDPSCAHPVRTLASLVNPPGGVAPADDTGVIVRHAVASSAKFLVRSIPGNGCVYGFWAADSATAALHSAILVTARGNDAPNATTPCPATHGGGRIPDDIAPGDVVDISGEYINYHAALARCARTDPQMEDLCAVTRRSTGTPLVPLASVDVGALGDDATDPSPYEASLITTQAATVTDPDPDHDGKTFIVTGAHGTLRVSLMLVASATGFHAPAMGARFTALTGLLYFANCHWQLVPRTPADLAAAP